MPDYGDPRDPIYRIPDYGDPRDPVYKREPLGVGALASDIGEEISDVPAHFMGAVGRTMEGIDPKEIWGVKNLYDDWINQSEEVAQERLRQPGQERPYFSGLDMRRRDVSGTGASLGFSAATMGTGIAAGLGTAAVTGGTGAIPMGATTSALVAYNQSGNEFLRRAVGMAADSYFEETGEEMTPDQKMEVAAEFIPFAEKHGLWEAGTEAVSNVLGFKILAAPLKKFFGEGVARNFLGKSGAVLGEELTTETITQIGQTNNEIAAGLSDEERREWNEIDSYSDSFREVVYPTILTTGLMGGAVATGIQATRAVQRSQAEKQIDDETRQRQVQTQEILDAKTPEKAAEIAKRTVDEVSVEEPTPVEEMTGRERIAQRRTALSPEQRDEIARIDNKRRIEAGARMQPEEEIRRERIERKKEEITQTAQEAATAVENEKAAPTPAQIEAGNYPKGHVRVHGLDISIENPKGSTRRSKPGAKKEWSQEMASDYGYIRGTVGRDKDHVDVFLGENAADETLPVFVVDQVSPQTGKFDEHKAIFGAASEQEARDIYLSNYEEGWQGLGSVTEMGPAVFKEWVRDVESTTKPVLEYEQETIADLPMETMPAPEVKKRVQSNFEKRNQVKSTDSLVATVAKLGGIGREEAVAQGVDPADFRRARSGILWAFNNGQRAQSFDGMAETLRQYGWNFEGPNDLLEALDTELRGTPQYTPEGAMEAAEQAHQLAPEEYTGDMFEPVNESGQQNYPPDLDEETRSVFELYIDAARVDEGAADKIFQSGASDGAVAQGLFDIIAGGQRETQRPESDTQQAQRVQEERPVAEAEDLFGGRDETAQAIKDIEVAREEKIARAPPVESGAGDLFSGGARQTDIEDVTGKPRAKTAEDRLSDILTKAVTRFQMEEQGQDILDDMQEAKESPKQVSSAFWKDTYPNLSDKGKQKFERYLSRLTGMEPGEVIAISPDGKEDRAETWEDLAAFWAGDTSTARNLEGTERGYVAMMKWANDKATEIQAKPQEKPRAKEIRKDEEVVQRGRPERPSRKRKGRKDIQQPAEAKPKASDTQALQEAAKTLGDGRIRIADLRKALPDMSAEKFDAALLKLGDEGQAAIYPIENPREMTDADREAALDVAGEGQHIVYFDQPKPTLRERGKQPERFLKTLPAQKVREAETGEVVEVKGAELAKYSALNQRVENLKQVLECIG